jgi:hypothetical protein
MVWTLCLAAGLTVAAPSNAARPQLVGTWRLDDSESEQPSRKLRPLKPGEVPERLPDGPDQDAPSTAEALRGRKNRGGVPSELEAPVGLGEFLDAPRTLTIGGTETVIVIADERGNRLQLPLDGSVHRDGPVWCSGAWEGQSLVIEKRDEAGVTLTHRYNLFTTPPRRLEVYSRLAGNDGRAVTLRRVYAAVEGDE